MSGETALSEAFLSGVSPKLAQGLRALPQLEETLRELLERARKAHPSLRFAPEDFLRHLAARLPATGEAGAVLASIRSEDLL
ncbi:MAG TPA: RNA polymerase subunit sigma-70, partial [Hyalangium sp.]|nr:RNA polymerase subunit sigma-70 [Hyalangium sp.]